MSSSRPRPATALHTEATAVVRRHASAEEAAQAVRALRRRELLRTAAADLLGVTTVEETEEALTVITAVTIGGALEAAVGAFERESGPLPTRICVVGMGRFGGRETGYGSDADVMFVHDPLPGVEDQVAARAAHAVAEEMRRLLAQPAPDPPLVVDPGLRPEGRAGPLVRTLASYRAYYERWSLAWEAQALLRAEPAAGDRELGERFRVLADEFRYPAGGISAASVLEIRRLGPRAAAARRGAGGCPPDRRARARPVRLPRPAAGLRCLPGPDHRRERGAAGGGSPGAGSLPAHRQRGQRAAQPGPPAAAAGHTQRRGHARDARHRAGGAGLVRGGTAGADRGHHPGGGYRA